MTTGLATLPAALALVALLGLPARPDAALTGAPPGQPPALAWRTCRLHGLEHDVRCARLRRPLDPSRPQGPVFDLEVALLPALSHDKRADPIFFFAGGPGQSAIALAGTIERLAGRLGDRRDIVLVDQRGTGLSAPLRCASASGEESVLRALEPQRLVAAMSACRATLQRLSWGDLRYYTTALAADDVEAVRAALGAANLDLVGVSYGTRVSMEYSRRYASHVRRMVLDGVAPADMALPQSGDIDAEVALAALMRDCAADADCARAHPRLQATWQALLDTPAHAVRVSDPSTGMPVEATVSPRALRNLVRPALYQPALSAVLPYALEQAAAGRLDPLLALASGPPGATAADVAEGEHFSVVCSEDVPRMDPGSADASGYRDICADWPRGAVPAGFYSFPRARTAALLLSGGLDPVTPPRHGARVAAALGPLARHVIVAEAGHGALALPCMREVLARFIEAEDDAAALRVDTHCADDVPRPRDFVPPVASASPSLPSRRVDRERSAAGQGAEARLPGGDPP